MKKVAARLWFPLFILLTASLSGALLFAVEERSIQNRFDFSRYNSELAREVHSPGDIVADFELQQMERLPISPPDPDVPFVSPGGTLPLDIEGFSQAFLDGLIPAERGGLTVYPITVYEDPMTQDRVILNAADQELTRVPAPGDYDPMWYVEANTPGLATMESDLADWYAGVYAPSRIAIAYDLILPDALAAQVWQMSLLSESIPPPPEGEGEGGDEGTNSPPPDWSGIVSNLMFVQIVPMESSSVVRVTIGIPTAFTNDVSVFTCTNLVAPNWSHLITTNAPATTNAIIFIDGNFATNNMSRYYNAMTFAGTLHPQAGDFETGNVGRVMISTMQDNHYYTSVPTTVANQSAQTEDHKVTITAHLPTFLAGKTVYFRVVSPDPDDRSPYETDSSGGDNRDGSVGAGVLNATSSTAQIATINGKQVAAAEVELSFTSHFAGDNYQIECSMESSFSRVVDRTCVLTAWKRIYIEEDQMCKAGADLASDFAPDENATPDALPVSSRSRFGANDFRIGDQVIVIDADNPVGETAIVTNIDTSVAPWLIYLNVDLTNSYNAGYGAGDKGAAIVIPDPDRNSQADVYDALRELFSTNAYGLATDGSDGGCFVVFVPLVGASTRTPYTWSLSTLPVGNRTPFTQYIPVWFGSFHQTNVFYLLAGNSVSTGQYGFNYGEANASVILVGTIGSNPVFNGETVVHELGHTWVAGHQADGNHPHDAPAHDNSDYCIMDYGPSGELGTIFSNGKTEFCVDGPDHMYEIRDYAF